MKTARIKPVAVEVYCPECEYSITSPTRGSYVWYPDDADFVNARGFVRCSECGVTMKIPAVLRRLADA